MSGILDSKSRVLDTVITTEGRRQLANGGIDIQYITFTDAGTFYKADIASGSQDATQRIYLESCQLPQDNVMFQGNDAGEIQAFANASSIAMSNGGQILEYSFQALTGTFVGSPIQSTRALTGPEFATAANVLLGSSAENLSNLYPIASTNPLFDVDGFEMGPNEVTFTINNDRPVPQHMHLANINNLASVFSDPRFSNLVNFQFLPPINVTNKSPLGNYVGLGLVRRMLFEHVFSELYYYESLGQLQKINFDPTSIANNVVGQFFEVSTGKVSKLDVIDYGIHPASNAHVFFVGKCVVDQNATDTFLHLFTLVFRP